MCGWQIKLCDPLAIRVTSERFSDEVRGKALYKSMLLYFTQTRAYSNFADIVALV